MALFPPPANLLTHLGKVQLEAPEGGVVLASSLWAKDTCLIRHVRSFGSLGCRAGLGELMKRQRQLEQLAVKVVVILPDEVAQAKKYRADLKLPFTVLADPDKQSFVAVGAKEINWATPENIRGMSQTSLSTSVRLNRSLRFMPATHLIEPGKVLLAWLNTSLKDDCTMAQILDALDAA